MIIFRLPVLFNGCYKIKGIELRRFVYTCIFSATIFLLSSVPCTLKLNFEVLHSLNCFFILILIKSTAISISYKEQPANKHQPKTSNHQTKHSL